MAKTVLNGNLRWVTALVGLLVVFASIMIFYVRPALADHEERLRTVEECMIEHRSDMKYMKAGIKDIREHMVRKDDN